jgi:hypothetical protein
MSGRFIHTSQVSPPQGRTVTVRSGGSVHSAALRQFSGWALIHGSGETSMPHPPEEWWLDDALAKEMGLDIDVIEAERANADKSGRLLPVQMRARHAP